MRCSNRRLFSASGAAWQTWEGACSAPNTWLRWVDHLHKNNQSLERQSYLAPSASPFLSSPLLFLRPWNRTNRHFFAYLSFLLSHPFSCALQKKHKQQKHIPQSIFLKGSATHSSLINEKSVIIYLALCMTYFCGKRKLEHWHCWASKWQKKNGALYSKSFEAIWWLCIRNGPKFELLFIENLLTWPRSLS